MATSSHNNSNNAEAKETRLHFLKTNKSSNRVSNRFSSNDILGFLAIGSIALNLIVLLLQVLLLGNYMNLLRKPAPSLVQLSSGEAIPVAPLASKERTPEVVLAFTRDTLSVLLTWTGTIPDSSSGKTEYVPDRGVQISGTSGGRSVNVTTAAYQAGFALSEDFRKEFLYQLGTLMPSGIFRGDTQVVFVPLEISQPIQIEEGKWKVSVIANLMVFNQNSILGQPIAFNKEVFVHAVEAPEFDPEIEGIARTIQDIRASGLEIYAIRDLEGRGLD